MIAATKVAPLFLKKVATDWLSIAETLKTMGLPFEAKEPEPIADCRPSLIFAGRTISLVCKSANDVDGTIQPP